MRSESYAGSPLYSPPKVSVKDTAQGLNNGSSFSGKFTAGLEINVSKENRGVSKLADKKSKTGAHFFQKYKHESMIVEELDPKNELMSPSKKRKESSVHIFGKGPELTPVPTKKKEFRIKELEGALDTHQAKRPAINVNLM